MIQLYDHPFGADRDRSCTDCTHTLDRWDASVLHAEQRVPVYVVAKSLVARQEPRDRVRR